MANRKILICDDEIYIVHILDFTFGMAGYQTITAIAADQALQQTFDRLPDLVILDVALGSTDAHLKNIEGYDLARRIRNDARTKHIPILLMSPRGRPINEKVAHLAGATETITKPFAPREILRRVELLLSERSL